MRDQVQYYLDRARAAARAATIGNMTEIEPVIASFIRAFEKIYREQDIRFTADIQTTLRFRGEKQDLEEMIGNLMDNAGKWANTRVQVTVVRDEPVAAMPMISLIVDDDGPACRKTRARKPPSAAAGWTRPSPVPASAFPSWWIWPCFTAVRSCWRIRPSVACAPADPAGAVKAAIVLAGN